MSVDLPGKAKEIFLAAIEINAAEERAAFVTGACMGDDSLRGRVQDLLCAHESPESLLDHAAPRLEERPGPEATVEHSVAEPLGSQIGRYKLREQIGEGGMGTVYVAEQEKPLRRKVALKVIKPGMDTKSVIARFEAERQALAVMDHPNIAKVLDAGTTERGRPYFVMELVRGVTITEYCDAHKLTIRQRLELFTDVCQAIQHAHQKGIIHRDIKPSNHLVTEQDGKAIPKVIDFGVAKAVGQNQAAYSVYTSFQSIIGTPLYMSPEQASLSAVDVDTRSDVYSLGVLLYELLTGTTPLEQMDFNQAAQHEVLRLIREEEPPRPSSRISTLGKTALRVSQSRQSQPDRLGRLVRGDLDWIAMKALEKERVRRYKSADALADDVQKYLANLPVAARPPSRVYRMWKFARRNRAAVIGTGTALLACVMVFVVVAWFGLKEHRLKKELAEAAFHSIFQGALLDHASLDKPSVSQQLKCLSDEQRHAIQGLRAFYNGDYEAGLNQLSLSTQSPATLAVKAWCEIALAKDVDVVQTMAKMKDLEPHTVEDHLMLAQLYFWLRPEEALRLIERAEQKADIGVIGQLVRALAWANKGLHAGDVAMVRDAEVIFESAKGLYPTNKFVREFSIFIQLSMATTYRQQGLEEEEELKHLTRANEAEIEWSVSHGPSAFASQLLLLQSRNDEAMSVIEQQLKVSFNHMGESYVATACLAQQWEHAQAFLHKIEDNGTYKQNAVAWLMATSPSATEPEKMLSLVEDILKSRCDSDARVTALESLLVAGVNDQDVSKLAKRYLNDTLDLLTPIEAMKWIASESPATEEDLRRIDQPSLRSKVQFVTGLRYYARGQYDKALELLASDPNMRHSYYYSVWSRYVIGKIEAERKPAK